MTSAKMPAAFLPSERTVIAKYNRSGARRFNGVVAAQAEWDRPHDDFKTALQVYCNALNDVNVWQPATNT